MAIYNNIEVWYEWQTGQDRQSGHSRTRVSEQRPNGNFPPVDVVQVLPGGVYAVLPLTSPLEDFVPNLSVSVCMDLVEDRIRR
jgi:hypothetical protein